MAKTSLNAHDEIMALALEATKKEEGFRAKPYKDTKGLWTVGYGRCLEPGHYPLDAAECNALGCDSPTDFNNIDVNEELASLWCKQYLEKVFFKLDYEKHPLLAKLSPMRVAILVQMCYQMGVRGVLGFPAMWRALEAGDFDKAADEMMDSKWAKVDSPNRAKRLASAMREDKEL